MALLPVREAAFWGGQKVAVAGAFLADQGGLAGRWVEDQSSQAGAWLEDKGASVSGWIESNIAPSGEWAEEQGAAVGDWIEDHTPEIVSRTVQKVADGLSPPSANAMVEGVAPPPPIPGNWEDTPDVLDCGRWPNSPYCGSRPGLFDPLLTSQVTISQTLCETCFEFTPDLVGVSGPVIKFCQRRLGDGACQIPAIKEQVPPSYPEEARKPLYPMPVAPNGMVRALYACTSVREYWGPASMADVETPLYSTNNALSQFLDHLDQQLPGFYQGESYYDRWRQYHEPGVIRSLTSDAYAAPSAQPWVSAAGYTTWNYRSGRGYFPRVCRYAYSGGFTYLDGWHTIHRATHTTSNTKRVEYTVPGTGLYAVTMRQSFVDETWLHWIDWPVRVGMSRSRFYLKAQAWESEISDALRFYSYGFGTAVPWSNGLSSGFNFSLDERWLRLIAVDFPDYISPPIDIPVPVREEPDPMDCCEELIEKIEKIELRLGCDEFPVDLPATLVDATAGQSEIENHAQFSAWFVRNLDALMGQFPIKITIADSDPTKEGEQEVDLELPNLAEGIAELFGLAYQSEIKADLLSEMLMRLIPEVIAGKNAAIVAQSYAKANASYMGYPGNLKPTEVQSNFNLSEVKSLPEFLKESTGKLLTYHEESKDTLQDKLERLMFAAGIIKSVFMVDGKDADRLIDTIGKMFDDEADNLSANKRSWEEWLQEFEKDKALGNKDQRIVPDVVTQEPPTGPEPV